MNIHEIVLRCGSTAVKDTGRDVDVLCTELGFKNLFPSFKDRRGPVIPCPKGVAFLVDDSMMWEFEFARFGKTSWDLLDPDKGLIEEDDGENIFTHKVTTRTYYLMKMSHRFLKNSPYFYKTMRDIGELRDQHGFPDRIDINYFTEFEVEWYKKRCKETYDYSHPSLDATKDEFFQDEYEYDHDEIHKAIMKGTMTGVPTYELFKEDQAEVKCSKELFDQLTLGKKLSAVAEEAMVLAIERSIVPFGTDVPKAFRMALMKVCTSITSGWFRTFAWENHDAVLDIFLNQHTLDRDMDTIAHVWYDRFCEEMNHNAT